MLRVRSLTGSATVTAIASVSTPTTATEGALQADEPVPKPTVAVAKASVAAAASGHTGHDRVLDSDPLDVEFDLLNGSGAELEQLLSRLLLLERDEAKVFSLVLRFVEGLLDVGDDAVLGKVLFDFLVGELGRELAHVDLALLGLGFLHCYFLTLQYYFCQKQNLCGRYW